MPYPAHVAQDMYWALKDRAKQARISPIIRRLKRIEIERAVLKVQHMRLRRALVANL
jgi:hypothetical protein